MNTPAPHPLDRADAFTCLIKDMYHRLDDATHIIHDLTKRVATLEGKPIIAAMNPEQIRLEANNRLVCTVGNADFVEFVDMCVNGSAWLRFWAEGQQPLFIREATTLIFQLPPHVSPINSMEIFTRYDRHTQTSEAGRASVSF